MNRKQSRGLGVFYSAKVLAERLGIDRVIIYGWAHSGVLPAYRIGPRRLRFRAADVERFLAACRVQPGAPQAAGNK